MAIVVTELTEQLLVGGRWQHACIVGRLPVVLTVSMSRVCDCIGLKLTANTRCQYRGCESNCDESDCTLTALVMGSDGVSVIAVMCEISGC